MSVRLKAGYQKRLNEAVAKVKETGRALRAHLEVTKDAKTTKLFDEYLKALDTALELNLNREYE